MEDPISFANRLSKIFHIPGQFFSFDLEDITINGESIITKEMRESRITIQMKLMETTKWQTK
jgi:hypothetical protein